MQRGQWTDDGGQSLCLADSLLCSNFSLNPLDLLLRFEAWWHCGYMNAFRLDAERKKRTGGLSIGIGRTTAESLRAFLSDGAPQTRTGDAHSSGNGSLMRLAPVAVCWHADEEAARAAARLQSRTTHAGIEAAECCALLASILCRLINCTLPTAAERKSAVFDSLADFQTDCASVASLARSEVGADGEQEGDWRWRIPRLAEMGASRALQNPGSVGSFAMDALRLSLHCVHRTDTFPEAVLAAANGRGDADTVAAITGQLAGALYGVEAIPPSWVEAVERWDGGGGTARRAHCLFARVPPLR